MRLVALRVNVLAGVWLAGAAMVGNAAMVCVGIALAVVGLGALVAALKGAQ